MAIVCINRPNRSKPRLFKPRDVGRIACRVLEQGTGTQEEIMAEVTRCMDDPCKKGLILELLDAISIVLGILKVVILLIKGLAALVRVLARLLGRIPRLGRLLRLLEQLTRRSERLEDATDKLEDLSTVVREALEQLPD